MLLSWFLCAVSGGAPRLDPASWVKSHGDAMYRYALGRVRDPEAAQNLVQEAFVAALKGKDRFSGRSTERTWLIGILKHKVIDHFRAGAREASTEHVEDLADQTDSLFRTNGRWKNGPSDWGRDPEAAATSLDFWRVLESCIGKLPQRQATAFSCREVDGMETAEICKNLEITETNLWVTLHRARAGLRRCLELNWVGSGQEDGK
jgi:RNA polymerase sigma-70 factor (TIGR02943 family)